MAVLALGLAGVAAGERERRLRVLLDRECVRREVGALVAAHAALCGEELARELATVRVLVAGIALVGLAPRMTLGELDPRRIVALGALHLVVGLVEREAGEPV